MFFLGRVEEDREWGRGGLHKSGTELGIFQESYPRRIFQSETKKRKKNKHVKTGGPVCEQIHFGEYQINLKAV